MILRDCMICPRRGYPTYSIEKRYAVGALGRAQVNPREEVDPVSAYAISIY